MKKKKRIDEGTAGIIVIVGAIVNDKPTWTLVTMAHSHLMVSLVHAHYINQEIIESKKLSYVLYGSDKRK